MAFSNNFVAVLVSNNKILRETRINGTDVISIPFGSEYSLRFKNLHNRLAVAKVFIDGENMAGYGLVIKPNEEVDFHGKISGLIAHNRFKFIEKTKEISDYRGDRIDDSIIKIEVFYQKPRPVYKRYDPINNPWAKPQIWCSNGIIRSSSLSNDGITVPGSVVDQKFETFDVGDLELESTVFTFKLSGVKQNQVVEKPKTVKKKINCPTCGRQNKSFHKYCSNCGTCLI